MRLIIIGKGPAGISAAVYAKRAGADVTIIAKDYGALAKAKLVENYYGFSQPISGMELAKLGEAQAIAHDIPIINEEVVGLDYEDTLMVITKSGFYPCDKLIMATGTRRAMPVIENFANYEGKGISYCAKCDAYFMRGKTVAVIGSGDYAAHELSELSTHASKCYLLTNGRELTASVGSNVEVITSKVTRLFGDSHLQGVEFASGDILEVNGLFVAIGSAGSVDFLKKFGVSPSGNYIDVDPKTMATAVPNIYAVGDATGGQLQIAQAVYQGMLAAIETTKK